ncbi:LacI family DNA-binding transcriptional regulator [Candidatus Amarolinea aalborgensis]|uniref:LacI family DNA-binding transcriptional regulator n=1 Tax=Candidatus Amarolinea aalborgensis TaxID=2249329 RepID=UPI003BF94D7F
MSVSIKDVAKAAGVSHSTVSRALAGHARIPEETRARIERLAQEMGYTPSALARGLAMQQRRTLGVVVASLTDPYASEVVSGIEAAARAQDFTVILTSSGGDAERELAGLQMMIGQRVDGLIVVSGRGGDRSLALLSTAPFPIVLVNSPQRGGRVYSVSSDNAHGAALAVDHLLELGHRRIAMIGGPAESASARERLAGYRATLASRDLKTDEALVLTGDGTPLAGDKGLRHLASLPALRRPTAIFCYNDLTAIGALHAAHRLGLAVPAELSLVGFDNILMSALSWPPLTTVDQRKQEMGRVAANIILELLAGAEVVADVIMRGRLVQRGSSANVCASKS